MPVFTYKIKNQKDQTVTGVVEARSDKDAALVLREQGFLVIDIKKENINVFLKFITSIKGISFSEIVNFTRQLSTMIIAGLTLTDSLSLLKGQMSNKQMVIVISEILHEVEVGNNLASALEKHPNCFSRIYVSLVRAGEASGTLDQVLARLAENLEKEREFRGKVKGAMIYPAIVIVGMVAVMFLMMTLVIPKLTSMYKDFNVDLPLMTRLLIFISNIFVNFWWLIILLIIGLFFFFKRWQKTKSGKKIWDNFVLRLPVWGILTKQIILVDLTRTLGLLISAGLPILEALNIVAGSIDNIVYREGIEEAAKKVEKGLSLGVPLSQNLNFPPILGQMAKVGEETGKLDESLLKLSAYFSSESEQTVKGLTTAIEPIIMVILGVGVGFMILAIIMPMYQLTSAIQ